MRIRTRSIWIIVFRGITQATQLIIGMMLVRIISQETLGSYRQIALVYSLVGSVFSLQLDNSLYYFYPVYGKTKARELVVQTLLVTGALSVFISLIMFFGADIFAAQFDNPGLAKWIRIYSIFPIVDRTIRLQPAFLICLDKVILSGVYTMFNAALTVFAVVIVFAMGFGITEAIWAKIAVAFIFTLIGISFMSVFATTGKWRIDKTLVIEQLNYCWPLMATTIVGVINLQLDGFLISSYYSQDVYAVYSVGAFDLPLISLVTGSLAVAIMPNMVSAANSGNPTKSLTIWHEAIRKSSLLIFPAFAFLIVCGYDFIVILYTKDYIMALWPFMIYLCKLPIRVADYGSVFRALGKTKPIAVSIALGFSANMLISVTLLILGNHSLLSYIGPSIGTFFGTATAASYMLVVLCKILDVKFAYIMRWRELGRIVGISLMCALILWVIPLPIDNLVIKFGIRFVLYVAIFIVAIYSTNTLKPDELRLIAYPLLAAKRMLSGRNDTRS